MNWRIEYFATDAGREPVREYIEALRAKEQAKIAWVLDLLADLGTDLREPHVKKLTGRDFWELRIKVAGKAHRIFYVAWSGRTFVLLHAFLKKTQKTPQSQLQVAEQRLAALRGGE